MSNPTQKKYNPGHFRPYRVRLNLPDPALLLLFKGGYKNLPDPASGPTRRCHSPAQPPYISEGRTVPPRKEVRRIKTKQSVRGGLAARKRFFFFASRLRLRSHFPLHFRPPPLCSLRFSSRRLASSRLSPRVRVSAAGCRVEIASS
jgi:hypothetical protein